MGNGKYVKKIFESKIDKERARVLEKVINYYFNNIIYEFLYGEPRREKLKKQWYGYRELEKK